MQFFLAIPSIGEARTSSLGRVLLLCERVFKEAPPRRRLAPKMGHWGPRSFGGGEGECGGGLGHVGRQPAPRSKMGLLVPKKPCFRPAAPLTEPNSHWN